MSQNLVCMKRASKSKATMLVVDPMEGDCTRFIWLENKKCSQNIKLQLIDYIHKKSQSHWTFVTKAKSFFSSRAWIEMQVHNIKLNNLELDKCANLSFLFLFCMGVQPTNPLDKIRQYYKRSLLLVQQNW